ncbi:MAG: hypothetical protein K0R90_1798, partial [Oscillospiraceae bacterium]|nr:hypothetical protein [Oscillospiraceae bacterium]
DRLRLKQGISKLKATFIELAEKQSPKAAALINDRNVLFYTVYLLIPDIDAYHLYGQLNNRNLVALNVTANITNDKKLLFKTEKLMNGNIQNDPSALKWMIKTGFADDGINDDFDNILDYSAALLIDSHQEKSLLPLMADKIFERNKKGTYNHDLIWAFFHSHDPDTLKIIAKHLRSSQSEDVKLAKHLLNIDNIVEVNETSNRENPYTKYVTWLKKNNPYLYFTEETFQYTSKPSPCNIDYDAAYLCKEVSYDDRTPVKPLDEKEKAILEDFHQLSKKDRKLLSKYSRTMHEKSVAAWKNWINSPIDDQKDIAKNDMGRTAV